MLIDGGSRGWLLWVQLACASHCLACNRATAASLLPTLKLGLIAQRAERQRDNEAQNSQQRWSAALVLSLLFQPQTVAAQIPTRAELAPETWILPCDADDVVCLQEALEAERELKGVLGELQ